MTPLPVLFNRVGRMLILVGCGYEVAALLVEHRHPRTARLCRPLSYWCHRWRAHRIGGPITWALGGWLAWHLWIDGANG